MRRYTVRLEVTFGPEDVLNLFALSEAVFTSLARAGFDPDLAGPDDGVFFYWVFVHADSAEAAVHDAVSQFRRALNEESLASGTSVDLDIVSLRVDADRELASA